MCGSALSASMPSAGPEEEEEMGGGRRDRRRSEDGIVDGSERRRDRRDSNGRADVPSVSVRRSNIVAAIRNKGQSSPGLRMSITSGEGSFSRGERSTAQSAGSPRYGDGSTRRPAPKKAVLCVPTGS